MNFIERMCTSKRRASSKSEAEYHLELKRLSGTASKDHTSYKCPICGGWHIGIWHTGEKGQSEIQKMVKEGRIQELIEKSKRKTK